MCEIILIQIILFATSKIFYYAVKFNGEKNEFMFLELICSKVYFLLNRNQNSEVSCARARMRNEKLR